MMRWCAGALVRLTSLPITKAFYHLSQYLLRGYSSISDGGIGAFSNDHRSL